MFKIASASLSDRGRARDPPCISQSFLASGYRTFLGKMKYSGFSSQSSDISTIFHNSKDHKSFTVQVNSNDNYGIIAALVIAL